MKDAQHFGDALTKGRKYLLTFSNGNFRCRCSIAPQKYKSFSNIQVIIPLFLLKYSMIVFKQEDKNVASQKQPNIIWFLVHHLCIVNIDCKISFQKIKMNSNHNPRKLSVELLFLKQNQYLIPLMTPSKESQCCCRLIFFFLFMQFLIDLRIHNLNCWGYSLNITK